MNSILITGCNKGLGLGIVKALVKKSNPPQILIATCRDIGKAEELQSVANQNKFVHLLEINLKDLQAFPSFVQQVSTIVKDNGLNVLFNNAGVSPKFTRLGLVKAEQLIDAFETNTLAPIMLSKAFLPLLKQSAEKNSSKPLGIERAAIINMSSYLASMDMNTTGGLYPYRCSKVALNMATRTMSIDLKNDGILATALHPGWVKTSMGGSNAPMEIEQSCTAIVDLLSKLGEEHNGNFYQYDGQKLPW
ncbi:short-chain dehydrogenase/reductase [Holotrichia oblita]|uniref:Short-chain dehydrogenase/reductase n=1 Tax=Holotrichia oblita TaxID=644536 RepID=A0ACB9T359_HOLOL|nr:short-chain dehydrogenase/reductase [Holotrichia oblita]